MKRIFLFTIFTISILSIQAQQEVVKWDFNYNIKTSQIEIKANIEKGWHMYSQFIPEDAGPVPTEIQILPSDNVELIGKVTEPEAIHEYDQNFESDLSYFENQVVFTQKVNVKKTATVDGSIVFMVCNNTMCLPPVEKKFTLPVSKK